MALIEVKNLKKYYPAKYGTVHAVDDVTLSIDERETLGVVGESGCGKSTLGKTLLRLTEPTSGEIWFDGKEITSLSKHAFKQLRPDMQMVFQDPFSSLDPRMTVSQLISEPLTIYKRTKSKAEMERKTTELMDIVGIAKRYAHCYPHEMDGGNRQRVGIARALTLNPRFIVCDEPVSALDVSIQAQVINLLQELQEQMNLTYMFITHDLSVVKHIANKICVMYLGRVVELGETEELFANTLHPYSKALLSAVPVPDVHYQREQIILKGEISSPVDPLPRCRFAPRCPYATEECFQSEPSLKDAGNGHLVACHKV